MPAPFPDPEAEYRLGASFMALVIIIVAIYIVRHL